MSETSSLNNKKHTIADLNEMYIDGDSCDQQVFSEMRSNILLVSGEHYQRRQSYFYKRIRDSRDFTNEQKVRLTKNHLGRIAKLYANHILSANPDAAFDPKESGNMHQQKIADFDRSLWEDAYSKYKLEDFFDDQCDSFVQSGEAIVKIFYDPMGGTLTGYEPQIDLETAQPLVDEVGQPIPNLDRPKYSGNFVFEEIYPFNLLRPSECKDLRKAPWVGIRKMVDKKELKGKFTDPAVQNFIVDSPDDTYLVFDGPLAGYKKTKNQVMIREFYFRPCYQYPNGYFFITTKEGILHEDELPGGVFPVIVTPIDKIATTPRGRSPVRTMRPYQVEINRSASKIAEHQITLGDDKLIIQNGSKISPGVALPGVRSINVTGMDPKVMAGRDGSQYLNYMLSQIKELYEVMGVPDDLTEANGQVDPYTLLFRSAKQKRVFQRYIRRFESHVIAIIKTYLRLAKAHLPDNELINAIGVKEQVNVPEYRNSTDVDYEITIKPMAGDIETKLGKQMAINHTLQYVGNQLKPEDIARIVKSMPYMDRDDGLDDLTLDSDMAVNEILALDRGEMPPVHQSDNHKYLIKKLLARTKKGDFDFLSPQVQQNYWNKIQIHQQIDAFQLQQIQRAEQGFIPTGGYLVTCDFYVQDPSDKTGNKTRRARLPYQAVEWLVKQLEAQGMTMGQLQQMDQSLQAGYAQQMMQQDGGAGGMPLQQPMGAPAL